MRRNKYKYILVIQGNYDCAWGWEDLSEYDRKDFRSANSDLLEYEMGESKYARHRIINRRVLNTQENSE